MNAAAWTFSALALLCFACSWLLHGAARGTDNFGAGMLFWVALALGAVFVVLAALLWLATLFASGFR